MTNQPITDNGGAGELLPCPFCGSDELGVYREDNVLNGSGRRIQCHGCNIEAPFYDTKAEAIAAWNRRAPEKAGEEAPVAAWVLQRNDFPHTVYFDEAKARAECARRHEEELKWREENRHVADAKTYWNVYKTMKGAFASPTQQAVPCYECGSTDRIGTACAPCNPELVTQQAAVSEGTGWQPITKDTDATSPIWAALRVSYKGGPHLWEVHLICCDDETGNMIDVYDHGWAFDDYEMWMPASVPAPPPSSAGEA